MNDIYLIFGFGFARIQCHISMVEGIFCGSLALQLLARLVGGSTGSFRKSGNSKTVFTGINFHKKWVFTGVFRTELGVILSSGASNAHHNHPEACIEAGAYNVLLGSGWLPEADH